VVRSTAIPVFGSSGVDVVTLSEFAKITRRIIASDGFDGYLPTALYPDRAEILVLEGIPENVDLELAATQWAFEGAKDGEEVLVAFKVSADRFKVVRRCDGVSEEQEFEAVPGDA
jgi:hypothetical protein